MIYRNGLATACLAACLVSGAAAAQEIGFAKVPELKVPEAGATIQPGAAVAVPAVPAVPPASNFRQSLTAQEMQMLGSAGKDGLSVLSVVDGHGGIVVPPHLPAGAPRAMIRAAGPILDTAIVGAGLTQGMEGMSAAERDNFYDSGARLGGCAVGLAAARTLAGCATGSGMFSAGRDGQKLFTDFTPEGAIGVFATVVSVTGPVGQAFAAGTTAGEIIERRTGAGGKFGVWSYDAVDTLQDKGWFFGTSDAQKMANAERRQQLKSDAMLREMRLRRYVEASTAYTPSQSPDTGGSAGPTFFDGFAMALGAAAQASANSSQAHAGSSVSSGNGWRGNDIRDVYQIGSPEDVRGAGVALPYNWACSSGSSCGVP